MLFAAMLRQCIGGIRIACIASSCFSMYSIVFSFQLRLSEYVVCFWWTSISSSMLSVHDIQPCLQSCHLWFLAVNVCFSIQQNILEQKFQKQEDVVSGLTEIRHYQFHLCLIFLHDFCSVSGLTSSIVSAIKHTTFFRVTYFR